MPEPPSSAPGLVRLETLATGFVPAQGILALFNPVFDLGPAIINLNNLARRQLELVTTKPMQGNSSPPCNSILARDTGLIGGLA